MDLKKCTRCAGFSLISLSLVCITANALLLVPDGKTWSSDQLSMHVLLLPGFIGGGLMVLWSGIGAALAAVADPDWITHSFLCSIFGMLGAIYCLSVSGVGLRIGPKCFINGEWDYHFQESEGDYLKYNAYWNLCEEPLTVVPWNVTLLSLLVVASCLEMVLCGVYLVNAIIGVICENWRKKEVGQHEVELWRDLLAPG
uniref:transmembrane 4 L6 family member 5-like n=1 Tax=Urocitellus parryii TaxID=9999 RepID=UPI000E55DF8E|nr:transmembrane 4 L6 family member 5-like [Urocitellus parryii]